MNDLYKNETNDFEIVQGDTGKLPFECHDEDTGEEKDITAYSSKFNIRNPITNEILIALEKIHNDISPDGDGIYYYNDTYKPSGLGMTASNQLVVVLTYADTATLEEGVYPFDVEFTSGSDKKTPIKGNLIVTREETPSVS